MTLSVKKLCIFFKDLLFIEDINFQVDKGEIFSIVGESGSGKSLTALSIINLLPDFFTAKGEVFFQDKNLFNLNSEELRKIRGRHISLIFQDPMVSLNPVLKAGFQVAELLIHHFHMPKKKALEIARELFEKFKISHVFESYPHQLSGGMRQRVMIAMAVACGPDLILADEPSTALDVTVQEEILDLLHYLVKTERKSLILITHDINILGEYADSVMVMYAGRIMEKGWVEEIYKNPLHPYTKALLECIPSEGKKFSGIPGNVPSLKTLPSGCVFHPRCSMKKDHCLTNVPALIEKQPGHWVRCFN
ncbi:ABC transporter ATP-binding protein [Thermodesulfovibrio hydrogeniphilus]